MRIAAVSVAPIFPDFVIGGSQKILIDVATGLKRSGHDVRIWCTGTGGNDSDFEINAVPVHPMLKLRGTFPATHQVSPASLAATSRALKDAADWADRVYLHADAVYLRHALGDTDVIRSTHDYVYEEALVSTLTLPADATIVPSEYLKRCIEATLATTGRKQVEPIVVIPNGIEVPEELPEPTLPAGVARAENDLILLFPHRPEPTKGVRQAIETAIELQRVQPDSNVRLLMPVYSDENAVDDAAGTSDELSALINELEASKLVELHAWLSADDMPGYYASGDITLCVGSFVESFGLVPIESVANGTPAICSRVGAFRQFADLDGVTLVEFGDIESTVAAIQEFVSTSNTVIDSGRDQIKARFSSAEMVEGYEAVISRSLAPHRQVQQLQNDRLVLAPWCDIQSRGIYDDYLASSHIYPNLVEALRANGGFVYADPLMMSASLDGEVRHARDAGVLIPEYEIA